MEKFNMLNFFIRNFKIWTRKPALWGIGLLKNKKGLVFLAFFPWFVIFAYFINCAQAEKLTPSLSDEEKEIFKMPLSELLQMDVVVTSPSKSPQKLKETASAIYVVTQEDIRRSGAVNLMEALRIVPGVQVSKINQNRYAISIRGFNRRLGSDKLLVLMDGRTLYSPSAAGVFWLGQDTLLEDIDRIEVIRGPGASLWGSNAVAGVINISTKSAKTTKGGLLVGGIGNEERGFSSLRYGAGLGEDIHFKVYGKYRSRDGGINSDGSNGIDDKKIAQGGFKLDWDYSKDTEIQFQGDLYNAEAGLDFMSRFISLQQGSAPFQGITTQRGGNFISRINHAFTNDSKLKAQLYYDRLERKSTVPFDNVVDQMDFEFQHDFIFKNTHNISWGGNYRLANFNFTKTNIVDFPNDLTHLYGFFFQDEITLSPDFIKLTLGSKFEHNQFSGWEIQPNIRANVRLDQQHSIWGAVSRAVRIPTIREDGAMVNRILVPAGGTLPSPLLIREENQGSLKAENLIAYEAGYRFYVNSKFNLDLAGFYFDYDDIIEFAQGPVAFNPVSSPQIFQLISTNKNAIEGEVFGFEVSSQWKVLPQLKLVGNYSYLSVDLRPTLKNTFIPESLNSEGDLDAEGDPQHIISARAYSDLPYNFEFDILLYWISKNTTRNIPAHERLDLRLGLKPVPNVELSVIGQNLSRGTHFELNELLERATQTERSYFFKATIKF